MNRFKSILVLLFGLTVAAVSQAQTIEHAPTYSTSKGEVKVNLFYNYGLPLGTFKSDFMKNSSPRGFTADVLYWFKPQWGVGGSFGYQDYYQKNARDIYKLSDGSDISAVVSHSMQMLPIVAKAMYMPYAEKQAIVQPYVSAGAGINIVNFSEYLGEFSSASSANAKFTAQAGAGVKIPFGKTQRSGFLLGATYNYTPYNEYDIKGINTINLQAGFQFKLK